MANPIYRSGIYIEYVQGEYFIEIIGLDVHSLEFLYISINAEDISSLN